MCAEAGMHEDQGRSDPNTESDQFRREAETASPGLVREFVDFLVHNKKWWIAPILVVLLLFGLIIMLAGTAAAPFIYTLF